MINKTPKQIIINPYWRQNPVFRGVSIVLPLLEGSGTTTKNLVLLPDVSDVCPLDGGPVWEIGEYGPRLNYNSTSRINTIYATQNIKCGTMTWAYWCSTTSVGSGQERLLYEITNASNNMYIGRDGNAFTAILEAADSRHTLTTTGTIHNDGNIHLMVVSSRPDGLYLFMDGIMIDSTTSVGADGTYDTSNIRIGYTSSSWLGSMTAVAVWLERGLSHGEVLELYNLGPSLGMGVLELPIAYHGAIHVAAGGGFIPAWAQNSNLIL